MQNVGLPQADGHTTVEDRLIWVARYFIDNGFYVILENHLSQEGIGDEDGTIIPMGTGSAATTGKTSMPAYFEPPAKQFAPLRLQDLPMSTLEYDYMI